MVFRIQVAERIVEIHSVYEYIYIKCRDYLIEHDLLAEPDILIRITQSDLTKELKRIQSAEMKGIWYDPWIKTPEQLEVTAVYRKIADSMLSFDTILMHGAVISTKGKGYIITAPRGVGKSTRARIWADTVPDSYIINGDKPLLRISKDAVYAYGTPWCGKEGWNRPGSVSLQAVLFLERTDREDDEYLEEMSSNKAVFPLIQQVYFSGNPAETRKTLELIKLLYGQVKFYYYRGAPTKHSIVSVYERIQ